MQDTTSASAKEWFSRRTSDIDDWSFEEDDLLTQRYDLGGEDLKAFRFVSEQGKSGAGAVSVSLETGARAQLAPKQSLAVDPEHKYRLVVQLKGDKVNYDLIEPGRFPVFRSGRGGRESPPLRPMCGTR